MSSAVPEVIFLTREHLAIYGDIVGGRSRGGDGADGCYTSCNAQESSHHEELHPKVSAVLGLRNYSTGWEDPCGPQLCSWNFKAIPTAKILGSLCFG